MANFFKSILIILFLIAVQLSVYFAFLERHVSTWGATQQEASMQMAGDYMTPYITSTRAIDIDAPKSDTWRWLMQLGADRGGFFSYYFIEKAMGYISRDPEIVEASFKDFKAGDIIRSSIKKTSIPFNFSVLSVLPEESLVLENWGTFKVVSLGENKSRLIIRTHGKEHSNILLRMADKCFGTPSHFLMERRTMMGIKARAETGPGTKFSLNSDKIWFTGVLLSLIALIALVFISRNLSSILLPFVLSSIWLVSVFMAEPKPVYSLAVAAASLATLIYIYLMKSIETE